MSRTARHNHRHRSGCRVTLQSLGILGFRYHLPSSTRPDRSACNLRDIRRYHVESFAYKRPSRSMLPGCESCSIFFAPILQFMHRENCLWRVFCPHISSRGSVCRPNFSLRCLREILCTPSHRGDLGRRFRKIARYGTRLIF